MADVTFGVKVPEEMKEELSDLMKSTQLTGKEFMGLLLSTYKLEINKEVQQLFSTDIEELQRLLQRIQNLYMNVNERASIFLEEQAQINAAQIEEVAQSETLYKEEISELKQVIEDKEDEIKGFKKEIQQYKDELKQVDNKLDDYQAQIKQSRVLTNQYELNIESLKKRIAELERFEIEIQQRQEENQNLQIRNDELASEIWFLQREKEKSEEEREREKRIKEEDLIKIKENHNLELKNTLLEQKLLFNQKIELIKEEYYEKQQQQQERIQDILINKSIEESKNILKKTESNDIL